MSKFFLVLLIFVSSSMAVWMDVAELPDSREHKRPRALSIVEARESIGYPIELAKNPKLVRRAKLPVVIIDAGFVGLTEYLKKNPNKKKNILKWINFYKKGKKATAHHGFDVYQSALIDSPDAEYYLFQVDLSDKNSFYRALKYMKKHKLYLANYSAGSFSFYGDYTKYTTAIHKYLEKYQITIFQSIGNEKGEAHYFKYSDINHNGALEFIKPKTKKIRTFEFNRIKFYKNKKAIIYLRWHYKDNKDIKDNITLKLVNKKNKSLPIKIKKFQNGIYFTYTAKKSETLFLQVIDKGIVNPKDKYFALFGQKISTRSMYANGFGMSTGYGLKESPFIITVGSYGMGKDGKLVPSYFSSYTKTVDGELLPHILGPGQLKIGKKEIQGTSFSSPFISAFYAKFDGYNIKNLVESTSSKKLLSDNLLPVEKGRWGVPNVMQFNKSYCLNSDKIENFTSKVEGKNILLDFDFSRRCMEKLEYKLLIKVYGTNFTPRGVKKVVKSEHYYSSKQRRSKTKDIKKEHMQIKIPLVDLYPQFGGLNVSPLFYIMTRNTRKPLSLNLNKKFEFKVPIKKIENSEGIYYSEIAYKYFLRGLNKEAIKFIDKDLKENPSEAPSDIIKLNSLKAILLLREDRYKDAFNTIIKLSKITPLNNEYLYFIQYQAALFYGIRDYKSVLKIVKNATSAGIYDVDLALLEYYANKFLKQDKPFRVGNDETSMAVDRFLKKETDAFKFYNALGRAKNDKPNAYNRILWNFILLQESILDVAKKKQVYSYGKKILGLGYIDSIYYIITKVQFGLYPDLKNKKRPKKIKNKRPKVRYTTENISRVEQIILDGKKRYYQIEFQITSTMKKDDIINNIKKVFISLNLPMKDGFYRYSGDKSIDKKILEFFKSKGDVKDLKIQKLVLQ